MKTIGLLGGMSWESTIPYYRLINEGVKQRWADCIRQTSCCTAWISTTLKPASLAGSGIKPERCWRRRRSGWNVRAQRDPALYQYHAQSGVPH